MTGVRVMWEYKHYISLHNITNLIPTWMFACASCTEARSIYSMWHETEHVLVGVHSDKEPFYWLQKIMIDERYSWRWCNNSHNPSQHNLIPTTFPLFVARSPRWIPRHPPWVMVHAALRPTRGSPETDGGKKGPVVFMKWMVAKGCFFFAYFNFYIIVYTDYVEIIYCMCICHSMYMWDSILLLRW